SAIRDGIDLLRRHGAGGEIKGHRDGYATACPGGPLYAWVQKGAPRPTKEDDPMAGITKQDIYDAVWKTDKVPAPKTSTTAKTNPTWQAVSVLSDIADNVRAVKTQQAAQTAAI